MSPAVFPVQRACYVVYNLAYHKSILRVAVHPDQDRASHTTAPSSDTLAVGGGSEVGYCSSSQWLQQAEEKRAIDSDGGASVAGGQRVEAATDARSVEDATSGKSTPPPSYREFEDDVLLIVQS